MTRLSALLPGRRRVGVIAALTREADAVRANGHPRTRGQVMADTLVARAHRAPLDAAGPVVPVTVNLVVSDTVLLGEPTTLPTSHGFGPIPGELARELVGANIDRGTWVWLRRLYERPRSEESVALDHRGRLFRHGLRTLIRLRDQTCRTPWCDAPIRHSDHAVPAGEGGPDQHDNGQGLCEACNHAKQAPDSAIQDRSWSPTYRRDHHPTGHAYRLSTAPTLGSQALADLDWLRLATRIRVSWDTLLQAG